MNDLQLQHAIESYNKAVEQMRASFQVTKGKNTLEGFGNIRQFIVDRKKDLEDFCGSDQEMKQAIGQFYNKLLFNENFFQELTAFLISKMNPLIDANEFELVHLYTKNYWEHYSLMLFNQFALLQNMITRVQITQERYDQLHKWKTQIEQKTLLEKDLEIAIKAMNVPESQLYDTILDVIKHCDDARNSAKKRMETE